MKNRRILLGLTGSVASILYKKLIEQLSSIGIVDVILTNKTHSFINLSELYNSVFKINGNLYTDDDEWIWKSVDSNTFTKKWNKNDPILHIELRNRSSALVIAPCSANTLAKVSNGLCDNLLSTVARAWDFNRPFIIAPAMNTMMYKSPITSKQLLEFTSLSKNNYVVQAQSKLLACNADGIGAMAEINDIVDTLKKSLKWKFPLKSDNCSGIPIKNHPGAFLIQRKYDIHTGVDLYTKNKEPVYAVEDGIVVGKYAFTGSGTNSEWWNDTECLLIEGASGVVCYGEIIPSSHAKVGTYIHRGSYIGNVKQVLKDHKLRTDINGHSTSMLHLELYKHGTYTPYNSTNETIEINSSSVLQDPTSYLLESESNPYIVLSQ